MCLESVTHRVGAADDASDERDDYRRWDMDWWVIPLHSAAHDVAM